MRNYINLGNNISSGNYTAVKGILDTNPMLNILHRDGTFIIRAIENNQLEIVQLLIQYFEKNQLSSNDLKLKYEMQSIIDTVVEDTTLSPELEKILKPYLLNQGSTTDSNSGEKLDGDKDPIDVFDPHKHFSNNSTQDCYPEEHLSVSGLHEDFNGES